MFWVRSDLESGKTIRVFNFSGGGVLGKIRFGLWEEFHFQGGVLEPNSRTGVFWRIWSKFSGNLA